MRYKTFLFIYIIITCFIIWGVCSSVYGQIDSLTVGFENAGWGSNDVVGSSVSVDGFVFSSDNYVFATNYGANLDYNGTSLFYVFFDIDDTVKVNRTNSYLFNFLGMDLYQVSEISVDSLVISGWRDGVKLYEIKYLHSDGWRNLNAKFYGIDELKFNLNSDNFLSVSDYNFDNIKMQTVSYRTGSIPITVSDGNSGILLTTGVHPDATEGYDPGLDIYIPPPPPAGAFDGRLVWLNEAYMTDIRDNTVPTDTFNMYYAQSFFGTGITLLWDVADVSALGVCILEDYSGQLFFLNMSSTNTMSVGNNTSIQDGIRMMIMPDVSNPVELTLFTIQGNTLWWETATEINNYGFELQRDKEKIAFIEGHGTSNSINRYSYVDNDELFGRHTYRLKQIDNDGTFDYSFEIETFYPLAEYRLYQNYPNPFNSETTIKITFGDYGRASFYAYNILGEIVFEKQFEYATRDAVYTIHFDSKNLPSGIYYYRLYGNNFSDTKKMVILK